VLSVFIDFMMFS